jgi:hypothetical protein
VPEFLRDALPIDDPRAGGPGEVWRQWLSRRKWAGIAATTYVIGGCLFSFFLYPVLVHHGSWYTPGDIWVTFRGAQYVSWGDFTDGLRYVSAPGTALLVAPAAYLSDSLRLVPSIPPYFLLKPTAWIVVGPYDFIAGSMAIFAFDRVAEQLDIRPGPRILLVWTEALALIPIVILYGHPEDVVSMSFALWGLSAGIDHRWRGAGWYFGVAILLQPISLLIVLPALALCPVSRWVRVGWRVIAPTALVMLVPLATAFGETMRFVHEPNIVSSNHPTPLMVFAPAEGHDLVSAGPLRLACVLIAAGIGLVAYRHRATPIQVIWCIGLALSIRVALEPVLDTYYAWPAIAVLLLGALTTPGRTRGVVLALLTFVSVYAFWHEAPWVYWAPIVVGLGTIVALVGRGIWSDGEGSSTAESALELEYPDLWSPVPTESPMPVERFGSPADDSGASPERPPLVTSQ